VAGRKSGAERQLTGQNGGRDDASQPPGVLAGAGGVRTTDTEHVEHGSLGIENGAAAESTDFE
jgi:hypothetical protein